MRSSVLLAGALSLAGMLMATGPTAMEVGLHTAREVGVDLARVLGRHHTNLSFLDWDEGSPHNIWIISSSVALLSSALIPFLVPTNLRLRLYGALALCAGVVCLKAGVPWPHGYAGRHPIGSLVVLCAPVIAVALWHLFQFALGRIQATGPSEAAARIAGWRWIHSVPAFIAFLWLASPNYFSAQEVLTTQLISLDARTGTQLWTADVLRTPPAPISSLNSHATPTPSIEGDTLVAAFGSGTAAFTLDGRLLWAKTLPNWTQTTIYGAGSSPVTDGQSVFVTSDREFDAERPSTVTAYVLSTGEERWSSEPSFAHDAYASPVVYDDGERKLLLTLTTRSIAAYDAVNGRLEWQIPVPVSQPVPSPIVAGDRLYVSGGKGSHGYTAAYQLRPNAAPVALWTSRQSPADVSSPVLYGEGYLRSQVLESWCAMTQTPVG